jgi:hypothetical protein
VIDEDECQEDVDENIERQERKRGEPPYANATHPIFKRYTCYRPSKVHRGYRTETYHEGCSEGNL